MKNDANAMSQSAAVTEPSRRPGLISIHRIFSNGFLAIIDQAVVSGTSFLTTVVIGRACGAEELGVYSLAFTMVVLATNLQTAVFTNPYMIYASRMEIGEQRKYAGTVLMHCLMFMVFSSGLLAAFALGSAVSRYTSQLTPVVWTLVLTMPWMLLREALRRFAFAHLRIWSVLALDIAISVMQLGGLCLLMEYGGISARHVYGVIGLASALAGVVTLVAMKSSFSVAFGQIVPEMKRSWNLGRWILASRLAAMIQMYAIHWLLAFLINTAATGVYAASTLVILLANPFVIGIGNTHEPRAAHAMAKGGVHGLISSVWSTTTLLVTVMGLYCFAAVLLGGPAVAWLYHGNEYAHQGATVAVLAFAALVNAVEMGAVYGLRILERPDLSFRAGLLSLSLTVVAGVLLIRPFGTLGGAMAVLAGDTAAAAVRWIYFVRLSRAAPTDCKTCR